MAWRPDAELPKVLSVLAMLSLQLIAKIVNEEINKMPKFQQLIDTT
jgi:hypothetical protein